MSFLPHNGLMSRYKTLTLECDSEAVARLAHDPGANILTVTFTNGRTYAYEGVSWYEMVLLLGAESIGKFINHYIKPFHPVKEVV